MQKVCFITLFILTVFSNALWAGAYPYDAKTSGAGQSLMPVVGFAQTHSVEAGQTLLDIARDYGLGFNEIRLAHPDTDPWVLKAGATLQIPTLWILPPTRHKAVVVNIAEMRLYRFFRQHRMVKTYPLGIGRQGFKTPPGESRVVERQKAPSWTVPEFGRSHFDRAVVPPGPQNPLGDYWLGLSAEGIGFHGTNFAWGVGRQVSHGCLRLYPEDMARFFEETPVDTPVEIVYEPVKIGCRADQVFIEVHPDIYDRGLDLLAEARGLIQRKGLSRSVDWDKVRRCVSRKNGIPTQVGRM
ncbi:MAG: L,D-transpeptidase family protein [Thermodesulfobacteriota bacterium]